MTKIRLNVRFWAKAHTACSCRPPAPFPEHRTPPPRRSLATRTGRRRMHLDACTTARPRPSKACLLPRRRALPRRTCLGRRLLAQRRRPHRCSHGLPDGEAPRRRRFRLVRCTRAKSMPRRATASIRLRPSGGAARSLKSWLLLRSAKRLRLSHAFLR